MKILVFIFFMIPLISSGQCISIDFESSDIAEWYQCNNNHWCLSSENPIDGYYSLSHCYDDTASGYDWIGYIHPPVDLGSDTCRWHFMLRYDHNPSSSNNWAVFLSDNSFPDQNGRLEKGLAIGVNYEGNSDELIIWKVSDGEPQVVLNTGFNWQDNISPYQAVSFSIDRSADGIYTIALDTSGTGYFTLGTLVEHSIKSFNTIILYYRYTATYDRGISFDDFLIDGYFLADTNSPYIVQVAIISAYKIEIQFSEPVICEQESTWCIDDIGCFETTGKISDRQELYLTNPLTPRNIYQLHTPIVTDAAGNCIEVNNQWFTFYYPGAGDIIINEILADPFPLVLLPETEYVEFYNTSSEFVSLEEWILSVNDQSVILPSYLLPPKEYLVVCIQEFEEEFDSGINIISVENMPALKNSGAQIRLQDRSGRLIHAIEYSDDWYKSNHKREGGWSLEMIDQTNPCAGSINWQEADNFQGGTPGERNSAFQPKQVSNSNNLWRAALIDSRTIILYFSKPLDSLSLANRQFYWIDHSVGNPSSIAVDWPFADEVLLFFDNLFYAGNNYKLNITSDVCDCSGSRLSEPMNTIFAVAEQADSGDILINEIMYDPEEGLNEYIELYNNSEKTIDLKDFHLLIGESNDSGNVITSEYWPMLPGTFAIITNDYTGVDDQDLFKRADRIVFMPDFPALPNTGSRIYLKDSRHLTLDIAMYDPDQHHEIYTDTRGISLERISFLRSGEEADNWNSASADAGFNTPAAHNSQAIKKESKVTVEIFPESITPDVTGLEQELSVAYRMDKPGYMVRIFIYDVNGRLQSVLANGTLLGTEGVYTYNGRNNVGELLATGFYICYFEAYNHQGNRYIFRKAFTVAR